LCFAAHSGYRSIAANRPIGNDVRMLGAATAEALKTFREAMA